MNRFATVSTLPVPFAALASEVENAFDQWLGRGEGNGQSVRRFRPVMDLVEHENHYAIMIDLPGVNPADVSIELKDHRLTISGSRAGHGESENARMWRGETVYGEFSRTIGLPETIVADGIEASYEYGVLTVSVPKQPKASPRKIGIRIADKTTASDREPTTVEAADGSNGN